MRPDDSHPKPRSPRPDSDPPFLTRFRPEFDPILTPNRSKRAELGQIQVKIGSERGSESGRGERGLGMGVIRPEWLCSSFQLKVATLRDNKLLRSSVFATPPILILNYAANPSLRGRMPVIPSKKKMSARGGGGGRHSKSLCRSKFTTHSKYTKGQQLKGKIVS